MGFQITGDPAADKVLDDSSFALLVGMMLDQQYPMEHAFRGPAKVLERLGTFAPAAIATADPDGDRGRNDQEYLAGTDPNSAASFWGINIERDAANAIISYERLANRGFEVQWSTNLGATMTTWNFLDDFNNRPFLSSTSGVTRLMDPIGGSAGTNAPAKFYRARIWEP